MSLSILIFSGLSSSINIVKNNLIDIDIFRNHLINIDIFKKVLIYRQSIFLIDILNTPMSSYSMMVITHLAIL